MGAAAPERAVKEVARGDVRTTARRWLGPLTVITTALFVVDTLLVASQGLLFFDLPVFSGASLFGGSFTGAPV